MLNLERLRTLDALARHGSVVAASAALHVTTSAVSQQLGKLERETGRQLIARQGRGVRLTDAGQIATQTFEMDWVPLLLLILVSVTGLGIWWDYEFMRGKAHDFMAITHAITVVLFLLLLHLLALCRCRGRRGVGVIRSGSDRRLRDGYRRTRLRRGHL